MHDPDTISADYTLRPSELAATLKILVEARQPVMVWGGPGIGKSEVAQQVAAEGGRAYYDVRALLLDPRRPAAASPGATATTAPAGLRRTSCHPAPAPTSTSSTWRSSPPACRWCRPRCSSSSATASAASTSSPEGRLAHGLRQPRGRPRRHPPHADAPGIALRPPRNQGRSFGLVRVGSRQRNRARDTLLHPAQAGASECVRILSRARRPSRVPGHGSLSQTS